jgi:hypothetical protein
VAPAAVWQTGVVPLHCESDVQAPHTLGVVAPQIGVVPVHCMSVQQLPGAQEDAPPPVAQQKSAGLEQAEPVFVQAPGTQRLVAVSQMSVGPYVASAWHCASVVHPPQVLAVVTPQIWPAVQSGSPWQFPATHAPAESQM